MSSVCPGHGAAAGRSGLGLYLHARTPCVQHVLQDPGWGFILLVRVSVTNERLAHRLVTDLVNG